MPYKFVPQEETRVRSLGCGDPLRKGMVTHSGILAWRIPWTKEPGGLKGHGTKEPGGTPWGPKESDMIE